MTIFRKISLTKKTHCRPCVRYGGEEITQNKFLGYRHSLRAFKLAEKAMTNVRESRCLNTGKQLRIL